VFNLDVAALQSAVASIALNGKETHEKFVTVLYYGFATTAVLTAPSLGTVSR
jgi:hypothetical protein